MRADLRARFLAIRERALVKHAAHLDALSRSGPVPSDLEHRRRSTRRHKAALLVEGPPS